MYVDKYVIAKKWSAHQPVPWMARVRHPQAVFRSLANAKEICLAARTNGARITNLNINLVPSSVCIVLVAGATSQNLKTSY
jgi:hypothetical protein